MRPIWFVVLTLVGLMAALQLISWFSTPNLPDPSNAQVLTQDPKAGELLVGICTLDRSVIKRANAQELLGFLCVTILVIAALWEIGVEGICKVITFIKRK